MKFNFTVPDICDAFIDEIKVGDVFFNSFGGADKFCGEVRTANCPHSNSIVKRPIMHMAVIYTVTAKARSPVWGINIANIEP